MDHEAEILVRRRAVFRVGLAVMAILLSLFGVVGCGDDDSKVTLTQEDVEAYEEGTPERAALEWWRAVQVSNTDLAADHYAKDVTIAHGSEHSKTRDLESQISIAAGGFQGEVEITSVEEDGSKATVFLELQPPDQEIPPQGRSLNFLSEKGEWRLADNSALIQAVARAQAARPAAAAPPPPAPSTAEPSTPAPAE